jgi:hypothetical protein
MIEVKSHLQWYPSDGSYGGRCKLRGNVVYWLGGVLVETRYSVFSDGVLFHTGLLGKDQGVRLPYELGESLDEGEEYDRQRAEEFIRGTIAPLVIMAVDGRSA